MSLRKEQCNKVCRILDDVLANRPNERDSLVIATRKAFAGPQWIPCKREQPTIDGKYNVTIRDGVFGRYVTELWYGKPTLPMNGAGGKRGWFETTPDGDYWYEGVIAWMPLPECYKGE